MKTNDHKLEALKQGVELPVDINAMWRSTAVGSDVPPDERAVLNLASAIHNAESTDGVVSWSAQERAANYFNKHGLYDTLTEMFRLQETSAAIDRRYSQY